MKWRAHTRRIILWSAASITVLLAVAWIGSVWWSLTWARGGTGYIMIRHGLLCLSDLDRDFTVRFTDPPLVQQTPADLEWRSRWQWWPNNRYIAIPLWAPLALSAAITALAWRQETLARRRSKQHACPACGYDISGLASGVPCPECGKHAAMRKA